MFWSDSLARVLLRTLPERVLREHWSTGPDAEPVEPIRDELLEAARSDPELRDWIATEWRRHRPRLVEETERLDVEELAEAVDDGRTRHEPRDLLLAVLTECHEDTRESVERLSAALAPGKHRAEILREWQTLADPKPAAAAASDLRVALVGGHARERASVDAVRDELGIRLDWYPADKSKGLGPSHRALRDLGGLSALVIVSGNIAHSTMHRARKQAEGAGVPCYFVDRITVRLLSEALAPMRRSGGTA